MLTWLDFAFLILVWIGTTLSIVEGWLIIEFIKEKMKK